MLKSVLRYGCAVLVLLTAWELLSLALSSAILPAPEEAVSAFAGAIKGPVFWAHFRASAVRVLAAMTLAWIGAFPLGILMGSRPRWDAWLAPLLFLTYPVPKIVLLPIMLLIFGLGDSSKIMLIALILGYQILVATRDGVLHIHPKYLDSVRSLGANRRQIWFEVLLPAALPHGFTALRLGTGTAVAVLFFAESFATREGLGYFIMDAWGRLTYDQMFTGIFGMSLLGVLLYELINHLEKWCCAWLFVTGPAQRAAPHPVATEMPMWLQHLHTYGRLIKFSHTIFALPFALAAVVLAQRVQPLTWPTLGWIVLALAAARSAAMGFNRLVDARFDSINPRTAQRPSVTGTISHGAIIAFITFSSLVFGLSAAALGTICLLLAAPCLAVLFFYSYTKRFTALSHLVLGFAIGLAPIGAWIAVTGGLEGRILLLSLALMTYIAGFDILYACQDVAFDREIGLHSLPARWGVPRALALSTLLHAATFALLFGLYLAFGLGTIYLAALAAIGVLLIIEHQLVRPDHFERIQIAFFHVNSAISIILLLGVWLDHHLY